MGQVNDLTEKRPARKSEPGKPISHVKHDMVGLALAAEGPKPRYYPTYRFTGKTFLKRDKFTNER